MWYCWMMTQDERGRWCRCEQERGSSNSIKSHLKAVHRQDRLTKKGGTILNAGQAVVASTTRQNPVKF